MARAAAIADRRELEWVVLRDARASLRATDDIAPWVVPCGGLRSFDIYDLRKAAKAKLLVVRRPEDFTGREW